MVLASGGYPGASETGKPITGIEDGRGHRRHGLPRRHTHGRSGLETRRPRARRHGLAATISPPPSTRAYDAVRQIHFDGMHYRRDIGRKGPGTLQW